MSNNQKNMPLVTIIVPFYNDEKYAEECIESILGQNYKNIEVILVDDGSVDGTARILKKFEKSDNRLMVISRENGGVSAARNTALSVASGEFICLVDQDDKIEPDFVSYYLSIIEGSDIALTPQPYKFNDKNKDKRRSTENDVVYTCSGEKAAEKMFYYDFVIAPWNKMIRREVIEKNKIRFHEKLFGGEGFVFSEECFINAKKVAVGSRKVYSYRVDNSESGMTRFSTKIVDSSIAAQKYLSRKIGSKSRSLALACEYANWHTHADLYNMMVGCKVAKMYPKRYKLLKRITRTRALRAVFAPIKVKERVKGIMYWLNPYIAAVIINRLRTRRFTVEKVPRSKIKVLAVQEPEIIEDFGI